MPVNPQAAPLQWAPLPARTPTGGPPHRAPTHAPALRRRNCAHESPTIPGEPGRAPVSYADELKAAIPIPPKWVYRSTIFRHIPPGYGKREISTD